jgi:putative ABC transport system permease protein
VTSRDLLGLAWRAIWFHRQRSVLTMLGILIGIASVILLTSIGEGTRVYVLSEFTQFGTTLVAISPGRVQTTGVPGALGGTIHPLTYEDAAALERVPGVARVVPVVIGTAPIEQAGRTRDTFVYGTTASVLEVWRMQVRAGRFLPEADPRRGGRLAVLGPKLKRELFGEATCLGRHVRVAGERFLVIGVMEPKGQFLGFDMDDSIYLPVREASRIFNRDELHEIDVLIANASLIEPVVERLRQVLIDRHGREEDFTITTQTGMIESLDRIIRIVSLAVGGIGAISLLVGSLGIDALDGGRCGRFGDGTWGGAAPAMVSARPAGRDPGRVCRPGVGREPGGGLAQRSAARAARGVARSGGGLETGVRPAQGRTRP